jgi:hypothetical protein
MGAIVFLAVGLVTYDLLFSKPEHLEGVIVEKIFVPGQLVSSQTAYGGARRSRYFITHQREDQWVAIVTVPSGDTLAVHCRMDHYNSKGLGDNLKFKKYDGHLVHIKYFAHNEEE